MPWHPLTRVYAQRTTAQSCAPTSAQSCAPTSAPTRRILSMHDTRNTVAPTIDCTVYAPTLASWHKEQGHESHHTTHYSSTITNLPLFLTNSGPLPQTEPRSTDSTDKHLAKIREFIFAGPVFSGAGPHGGLTSVASHCWHQRLKPWLKDWLGWLNCLLASVNVC